MLRRIGNQLDEHSFHLVALRETVAKERQYDEKVSMFFLFSKYFIN
jgi:hypothetical protein